MFIKIIKNGFSRWWDKMGYAILTSIFSAINPFFLASSLFLLLAFLRPDSINLMQNLEQIAIYLPVIILVTAVFPTTFAGIAVQKRLIETETIYFKQYFGDYFRGLWKFIGPSLKLTLLYAAVGFLLSFGGVFYFKNFASPVLKFGSLLIIFWIYIFVLLSRYILIPLIIYNPEMKTWEAIKLSFKIVMAEGLAILGIVIIDLVLFLMLVFTRIFFLLIYYGLSSSLRVYTHKEIIAKYREKTEKKDGENVPAFTMQSAWADLMKRVKDEEREKSIEKLEQAKEENNNSGEDDA